MYLVRNVLFFLGPETSLKRRRMVLACLGSNLPPKPSILDTIRHVFDDSGPDQKRRGMVHGKKIWVMMPPGQANAGVTGKSVREPLEISH